MNTYSTLSGRVIEYRKPSAKVAAFLDRVTALVDDPKVTWSEMCSLIYGPENPILDHDYFPGRAMVTPKVLDNPIYHVLADLLGRKEIAVGMYDQAKAHAQYTMDLPTVAKQLGITQQAVWSAVNSGRLPAVLKSGQWCIRPESVASFKVSKAGRPRTKRKPVVKSAGSVSI